MERKNVKTDYSDIENRLTRTRAIRAFCLDCIGGYMAEVRNCKSKYCPLWPYRMGNEKKGRETD